MPQKLIQEQKLTQAQVMRLTQAQVMAVKLLEMPLVELQQNIENELIANPALEKDHDENLDMMGQGGGDAGENDNYNDSENYNDNENSNANADDDGRAEEAKEEQKRDKEELDDDIETALNHQESDDETPDNANGNYSADDYREIENGNTKSFIESLREQMGEIDLTEDEQKVMEYLIGSLDDDGLLHTDLESITEHLYIDEYLDVTNDDVEKVLKQLQTFDPAGIGARSLQECLLLQIDRMDEGMMKKYLKEIITNQYDEFCKNHWDKIKQRLELNDLQVKDIREAIKHYLNPKPGSAFGESVGISLNQITPDFLVYVSNDGHISFDINDSDVPRLCIADSFEEMMASYKDISDKQLTKKDKEARDYINGCVEKGNWYIEAIRQRHITMELTMRAIIQWQRKYFLEGEEAELRPMILEDIAKKTGLDISTISRVSRSKYVQSPWGIQPLKFFFTNGYTTEDGEELSTKKIKLALKEIIEKEDKKQPLSDELLVKEMKKAGTPIARRTIAKYREQMGIPVARLRKK